MTSKTVRDIRRIRKNDREPTVQGPRTEFRELREYCGHFRECVWVCFGLESPRYPTVETLRDLAHSYPDQVSQPLDLAVMAMASQRLGRTQDNRAALDRLRSLVKTGSWANDEEALGFLRE